MSRAIERFEHHSSRTLVASFAAALFLQSCALVLLTHHFSLTPAEPAIAPVMIEAQIYEKPTHESHLTEAKKEVVRHRVSHEPVLSKVPNMGKENPNSKVELEEQNQTQQAQPQIVSHGPIVLASPAPKLPSYLRDQNLNTSVLIEFWVDASGSAMPHLLGSSGNEEIDALALKSVRAWKFSPAMDANKPVPSKVRLRINFEVQ